MSLGCKQFIPVSNSLVQMNVVITFKVVVELGKTIMVDNRLIQTIYLFSEKIIRDKLHVSQWAHYSLLYVEGRLATSLIIKVLSLIQVKNCNIFSFPNGCNNG